MWIKLDHESLKKFDLTQFENVWSLAVDKSQIVYLRSDSSINKGNLILFNISRVIVASNYQSTMRCIEKYQSLSDGLHPIRFMRCMENHHTPWYLHPIWFLMSVASLGPKGPNLVVFSLFVLSHVLVLYWNFINFLGLYLFLLNFFDKKLKKWWDYIIYISDCNNLWGSSFT